MCPILCEPTDCSLPDSSSMRFSRQEDWSGLPFTSPVDLPDPGIKPDLLHHKQISYHLSYREVPNCWGQEFIYHFNRVMRKEKKSFYGKHRRLAVVFCFKKDKRLFRKTNALTVLDKVCLCNFSF